MNKPSPEDQLRETTIESEKVYDGKLLQVYFDKVQLPDGSESARDWIKHPGASAIVPVFEDGSIMLVKQFRYPPRELFIEVPAGKLDDGELPEVTARRELSEESGLTCSNLTHTGSFYPAIGYADELIHIYAAWGLKMEEKSSDDDEFLLNYRIPFSEALNMIESGEIHDGKTICALTKTFLWWRKHGPFEINFG
ncbi:MAG: NUDIX hydrolase [Balneolaceae bacterium]|nr:NUDIX hydrolase [Balneolaceae bacterium]